MDRAWWRWDAGHETGFETVHSVRLVRQIVYFWEMVLGPGSFSGQLSSPFLRTTRSPALDTSGSPRLLLELEDPDLESFVPLLSRAVSCVFFEPRCFSREDDLDRSLLERWLFSGRYRSLDRDLLRRGDRDRLRRRPERDPLRFCLRGERLRPAAEGGMGRDDGAYPCMGVIKGGSA